MALQALPAASRARIALTAWLRVKEALARQSPRVLVLEVDAMYRNPNMHKNHWKMFVDKVKAFPRQVYGYSDTFMNNAVGTGVGYLFAGVKYHSRWKELTRDDFTDIRRKFYHYVGKGYLIHTMTVPYQGGFDYMEPGGRDEPLSKEALRCLHRVMELCKERGIQLMLLEMPSASSWSYEKHQAVSEFARQNGLPFLDLNVEAQQGRMVFDWTKHSKDGGDHLNLFGAEIATAYLGAYLKESITTCRIAGRIRTTLSGKRMRPIMSAIGAKSWKSSMKCLKKNRRCMPKRKRPPDGKNRDKKARCKQQCSVPFLFYDARKRAA